MAQTWGACWFWEDECSMPASMSGSSQLPVTYSPSDFDGLLGHMRESVSYCTYPNTPANMQTHELCCKYPHTYTHANITQ